jgi:NDP-sugar pyrophosphorylase family protein
MNAMVLAAGRGTRLGALGERVAKALVVYGDVLVDEPIAPVVASRSPAAAQTVYTASDAEDKEDVELAENGQVTVFVEKPERRDPPVFIR